MSVAGKQALEQPSTNSHKVSEALESSKKSLLESCLSDHWCFELEADSTIPSEYILLQHYLGRSNKDLAGKVANYICRKQNLNGSWSLYEDGPGDMSATVKAYLALKLIGHNADDVHMISARNWVLTNGGAEKVNVFTRITLAFFDQLPWRTVPAMPVEMMFLPKWWFFNLNKVSYWSRCVIVPLLIIFAKRPTVTVSKNAGVSELFISDPKKLWTLDKLNFRQPLKSCFVILDRILKKADSYVPKFIRNLAIGRAEQWTREHCSGTGGIGAIFPAMVNAVIALKLQGAKKDDPDLVRTLAAIDALILENDQEAYCQPCVSPVWDTCLALSALTEAGVALDDARIVRCVKWLFDQQIFTNGDWCQKTPGLSSGGWAFQYENDKYPDVDDTSMVLMALLRAGAYDDIAYRKRMDQAVDWVLGMQNPNGGWAAFDVDNNAEYLNKIPFADHGALVDPSTADLTARCIEMLAMLGHDRKYSPITRGLNFLKAHQESNGSWYGRWGVNYIYGTWSVLAAIGAIGEEKEKPYIQKAVRWLEACQNEDGGWGESCNSYDDQNMAGIGISTPSQTSWALLGLMSVGRTDTAQVTRGINYLLATQNSSNNWDEESYTGTGFPRVFYLRYHGYRYYFPVWALGCYQHLKSNNPTRQAEVMTYLLRQDSLSV
jgi:squalene-hopene/tetraprenyl-beta-curcumene cyclase